MSQEEEMGERKKERRKEKRRGGGRGGGREGRERRKGKLHEWREEATPHRYPGGRLGRGDMSG